MQSELVSELISSVEIDKEKIVFFGSGLGDIELRTKKTEENILKNMGNIKEIVAKVSSQGNRIEEFESENFSGRERVNKISEGIDNFNRTVQLFENQHTETVKKMLEIEEQNGSDLTEIRKHIQQIDNDKIRPMNEKTHDLTEKIVKLEDGHMSQLQKIALVERLGERVTQMDEQRQQTEARAKDEVDASMSRTKEHMERLEKQIEETAYIQAEKIPLVESLQTRMDKLSDQQVALDQQRREEMQYRVQENVLEIQVKLFIV